jgi:hypothetical protein
MFISFSRESAAVRPLLVRHFGTGDAQQLRVAERKFPARVRADVQRGLADLFDGRTPVARFTGVQAMAWHQKTSLSDLLVSVRRGGVAVAPPEYEDVDVGEDVPVRCLKVGLWLAERAGRRFALLVAPELNPMGMTALICQVATGTTDADAALADELLRTLERSVNAAPSYRGKVLSLEGGETYTGQSTGIRVHRLGGVAREQVVLPTKTLALLDRNVIGFAQRRSALAAAGLATRKGLLFYGPPGTGKSHTIRYLTAALPGHTTLLITAEQVGLLGEYMTLARLLQPSIVVIEDVDLIARDRTQMDGPCQESLLNKLLNEMDGLRESADVLFLLTTNRPEALEMALASRPGRVDQAIEFPLPDEAGRRKLVQLYAGQLALDDSLVSAVVARTERVSAAFIKELMRRAAQFRLERDGSGPLLVDDVDAALDEMLFSGGRLNLALLGGVGIAPVGPESVTVAVASVAGS